MNTNAMMTIITLWAFGLVVAYKFAELGYPWLAFLILLMLGSIRIKWGDDKKTDEEE